MTSRKLRDGYQFRHFSAAYGKKPGLYFNNVMGKSGNGRLLNPKEIVEIRDWLSRYINQYINQKPRHLEVEARAHARAILRTVDELEANK